MRRRYWDNSGSFEDSCLLAFRVACKNGIIFVYSWREWNPAEVTSENLAARLKAIRVSKGLTRYRLAKVSQVAQSYIYRIENDEIKNPRRDTLQKLAYGLNITLAKLIGETKPHDVWSLIEQSLKAYIPVYSGLYEVGMGPIDHVVCTRSEVPPDTVRGYRIAGLFLEPEIRDGDTIIVDTTIAPVDGDLVMARIGDEIGVARYIDDGGHKRLEDNEG